jgi:hypothetical protein
MSLGHGAKIVTDSLAFMFDMANKKSWKGKPVENLVAAGQRTCSSGLARMSAHVQSYSYQAGVSYGKRKDVIKGTITPTTSNPYADYGFQVSRSGGSQVGDVYWISFEYINVKGGSDPSGVSTYANGYKNPSSASAGTLSDVSITELPDGWKRWSGKVTITAAGNTWWRFGQNSNSQEVEFYLDNFQIIYSNVDAPFVDGTRSNTEAIKDLTGNATITASSPSYTPEGQFTFNAGTQRLDISNSIPINNNFSWSAWVRSNNIAQTQNIVSMNGPYFMRISNSRVRFNILPSSGWLFQNGTTVLSSDTWYHFCMVWNGEANTWSGYINGTQEFSVSRSGTVNYGSLYGYVGYTPQGGEQSYFNGDIPVLYCHNKALTDQEVKQNFEAHRARYGI